MVEGNDADQSAAQINRGDASTTTKVEAPKAEQFTFHMEDELNELNRTLEVVQETYVQASAVEGQPSRTTTTLAFI